MFIEERNKILVKRGVSRTLEIQAIFDSVEKEIKYFVDKQTKPDLDKENKERFKKINEDAKNNKYDNRLLFFTFFNDVNKYTDFNEWKPFYEEKVKKNRLFQSNRNIPKSTWSDGKVKEEEKIAEKKRRR